MFRINQPVVIAFLFVLSFIFSCSSDSEELKGPENEVSQPIENNEGPDVTEDPNDNEEPETDLPIVTLTEIFDITEGSAFGSGSVTANEGVVVSGKGLCWSTSPNPTFSDIVYSEGSSPGEFITPIEGLEHNTTYYVRAFAWNTMETYYSNELSFTTLDLNDDGVYEGNIVFTTQEEIIEFGSHNYFEITGTVEIGFEPGSSITDLSPLSALTTIGGDLNIEYMNGLANLSGLENITSIGGMLQVTRNDNLISISGLSGLLTVGGSLWISDNSLLSSLDGLNNLSSVEKLLLIDNPLLDDIAALGNLTEVINNIKIDNNDSLMNLDGLSNLTSVGNSIEIVGNSALNSVSGLSGIINYTGDLKFNSNGSLVNLDGLANFIELNDLLIFGNELLENLDGLSGLITVNGNISIAENRVLTNLDGLSNLSQVTGGIYIQDNYDLFDFCGLQNLLVNGSLAGPFTTIWNGYNPTQQDIIDGNCDN